MKENLDEIITNIELIENNNLKTKEIERVLKMIDSYKMDDYQLHYLKGYLWNLLPFDSEKREQEIETNLKKSIDLKSDYIYSKTELSFFYFDKKKYNKVIELLNNLDFSFFENNDQLWKSLKLQELLSVSKLYESREIPRKLIDEFIGLITAYIYIPEEEIAIPTELINAVIENKKKKGMKPILEGAFMLVNSKNQKDYFDESTINNLG